MVRRIWKVSVGSGREQQRLNSLRASRKVWKGLKWSERVQDSMGGLRRVLQGSEQSSRIQAGLGASRMYLVGL